MLCAKSSMASVKFCANVKSSYTTSSLIRQLEEKASSSMLIELLLIKHILCIPTFKIFFLHGGPEFENLLRYFILYRCHSVQLQICTESDRLYFQNYDILRERREQWQTDLQFHRLSVCEDYISPIHILRCIE